MRKLILSLAFCMYIELTGLYAFCQYNTSGTAITWESGFAAGVMNCLTDLGGNPGKSRKFINDVNWSTTRLCGTFFATAIFNNFVGARMELAFGYISAADNNIKNGKTASQGRFQRNLGFRSRIKELSLLTEIHPLAYNNRHNRDGPTLSGYILTGIGLFQFCPEAWAINTWVRLPLLHTEGQGFAEYPGRKPYRLKQLNLPVGFGVNYRAASVLKLRLEIIYRKLWTDYLDDVSETYIDPTVFNSYLPAEMATLAKKMSDRQAEFDPLFKRGVNEIRGNKENNDCYFSFLFKMGWILGR